MLLGTTIDDLTALVQRAEAHAEHPDEERKLDWTPAAAEVRTASVYELVRTYGVGAA